LKNKFVMVVLLLCLATPCQALNTENAVLCFYDKVVAKINCYYPGPIANELAKFAMMRQLHEDGNKPHDYSVPGLGCGEPIKSIVYSTPTLLQIGRVVDSEGMSLYSFKGELANTHACLLIAKFFDYLICNFLSFKPIDKYNWERAKKISELLEKEMQLERLYSYLNTSTKIIPLIKRANSMYGPMGSELNRRVDELRPLFAIRGCL